MLTQQRPYEFRGEAMLQSYSDGIMPEHLNYYQQQVNSMPPLSEYGHSNHSWYSAGISQENLNNFTKDDFFNRGSDSKTPSEWGSYHSDHESSSSYLSQQINSNGPVCSDNQYHSMVPTPQMPVGNMSMGTPPLIVTDSNNSHNSIVGPSPEPVLNNVNATNGTDRIHEVLTPVRTPATPVKDEESLPRIEGPKATKVDNNSRESMKLPGFHQTFSTITEIGRFSQHDDYFEARAADADQQTPDDIQVKVTDMVITPPKQRRTRGRKRKQPDIRETSVSGNNYGGRELHNNSSNNYSESSNAPWESSSYHQSPHHYQQSNGWNYPPRQPPINHCCPDQYHHHHHHPPPPPQPPPPPHAWRSHSYYYPPPQPPPPPPQHYYQSPQQHYSDYHYPTHSYPHNHYQSGNWQNGPPPYHHSNYV